MFVKQIDRNTAFELAMKGKDVLVMEPTTSDPKKWTDYETNTLGHMLNNCLFFRQEPAMEVDLIDEDKDPSKDPQEEAPPTGKRRGAKRAVDVGKLIALHNAGWPAPKIADELGVVDRTVYAYLQRMRNENQDGEVNGGTSERD